MSADRGTAILGPRQYHTTSDPHLLELYRALGAPSGAARTPRVRSYRDTSTRRQVTNRRKPGVTGTVILQFLRLRRLHDGWRL